MRILIFIFILSSALLWVTNNAFATDDEPKLVINEVMPNPVGDDSKFEWIEIKNTSNDAVNLNEWTFNGLELPDFLINPKEIILLTRDHSSLNSPNKMVDFTFNLVNSGATLILQEIDSSIENKFSYVQSIEGKSFEILSGECSKIAIHNSGHTMGLENTTCDAIVNPSTTPFPTVIYYTTYDFQDLIISAISPYPSQGSEWIELLNDSGSEINLDGWILKDDSNKSYKLHDFILNSGSKTRIFPATISLNNDGDTINLYDPQNKLIDSFTYEKVDKDQLVTIDDDAPSSEKESDIIENRDKINDIPLVKSINTETNEKSIYEILKKPIYYLVEHYVDSVD